jgi:hypothetical protein
LIDSIEKIKESDFSKYKDIIDLTSFLNFIKTIQSEIKLKSIENKKYDWLKTNIQYIFDNVSKKESYKTLDISDTY